VAGTVGAVKYSIWTVSGARFVVAALKASSMGNGPQQYKCAFFGADATTCPTSSI
jgi:hypothetical protein